jgi:hypothetical protein
VVDTKTLKEAHMMWVADSIIRDKKTGDLMKVAHVYRNCTLVTTMPKNGEPAIETMGVLYEKDYDQWACFEEFENSSDSYNGEWEHKPVQI